MTHHKKLSLHGQNFSKEDTVQKHIDRRADSQRWVEPLQVYAPGIPVHN